VKVPPFNRHFGIELVDARDGRAEVMVELGPQHLNLRGAAHGGIVVALLDSALGAAVVSSIPEAWWCATTSLSTQFLEGAGPGRLTAWGSVARRGRHVAFAQGEARDAHGTLVATAQGTWHLWPHRPAAPAGARGPSAIRPGGAALPVGKILGVGRNYADHVREMGGAESAPPVVFLKPPSALVTGARRLPIPTRDGVVHHEIELVVAIGARGRAIPREAALDHVLGYAVGLDLTLRDVQEQAKRRGEPWALAKGFDGSAPVSDVTPRAAVGDGSGLALSLAVNDEVRQRASTSQMLWSVADLVALVSRSMTLERGDLLFTGTPAGVGPLVPGDRVVAEIERVGRLELEVEAG
jgi:uncharacterized protein (TIGR00369 family)